MTHDFQGYMIVRKPGGMTNADDPLQSSLQKLHFPDEIRYAGVDRLPWSDFDTAYYAGALPNDMKAIWQKLETEKPADRDFRLLHSYAPTALVLEFLRQINDRNEVCAVYTLNRGSQVKHREFEIPIQWLGIDLYVSGYGSALTQGIFARPDLFPAFIGRINRDGLFNLAEADSVLEQYRTQLLRVAPLHNLEVMPGLDELWHEIVVGRV